MLCAKLSYARRDAGASPAGRRHTPASAAHRSGRPGALDPEQVVIPDGQAALAPSGFVNGLGNSHCGGDAVLALRRDRARRDFVDECLPGGHVLGRRHRWRRRGHGRRGGDRSGRRGWSRCRCRGRRRRCGRRSSGRDRSGHRRRACAGRSGRGWPRMVPAVRPGRRSRRAGRRAGRHGRRSRDGGRAKRFRLARSGRSGLAMPRLGSLPGLAGTTVSSTAGSSSR